ncbi:MAG: hypothetical protein M3069_24760 [Chloroflexota bacterium]|nr:hypothetical protein [Chloroflexota bacterium]
MPDALPTAGDDPENPDNWYGLDYVHDRITAQLQEQSGLWQEVDGGLRLILGAIGVVFAAALGLLPRGSATISTPAGLVQEILYLPFWVGALAIGAIGLFALAGLLALVAYWPRTFSWPPAPESLREYLTSDEREIKLIVVDAMLDAFAANSVWLGRKLQMFSWALALAALAAGFLGAGVILEVLQLTRAWR